MIDLPKIDDNCKYYILDYLEPTSFTTAVTFSQVRSHLRKYKYKSARLISYAIAYLVGQSCVKLVKHISDDECRRTQPDKYYITEQGRKYLENKLKRNHLMFSRDFVAPCKSYQINPVQLRHSVPVEFCEVIN